MICGEVVFLQIRCECTPYCHNTAAVLEYYITTVYQPDLAIDWVQPLDVQSKLSSQNTYDTKYTRYVYYHISYLSKRRLQRELYLMHPLSSEYCYSSTAVIAEVPQCPCSIPGGAYSTYVMNSVGCIGCFTCLSSSSPPLERRQR